MPTNQTNDGSSQAILQAKDRRQTNCCRCNRTGSCQNCSCVKASQLCAKCAPGRLGHCQNKSSVSSHPSQPTTTTPPQLSTITIFPQPAPPVGPISSSSGHLTLPHLDSILSVRWPTLQHIPKGARDDWADLLRATVAEICTDPSDVSAWSKFFMLPRCVLASPARGGRSHWRSTMTQVKARIRRWRKGEYTTLWEELISVSRGQHNHRKRFKPTTPEKLRKTNASRAKTAVGEGLYRKAIQALTSGGLAPNTPEVVTELLAKHPQSPLPTTPAAPAPLPPDISEGNVFKALTSFPNGSAPGPSGLRANHLKEAVKCPSPERGAQILRALSSLVNLLCGGRTPPEVVPHLCGATLLACKKKSGGVRPIAVGEVLRRLTSKCLTHAVQEEAISVLTPLQLGVGVKGGCEAIVHSVNRVLEDDDIPPNKRWTILLDFSNAFNNISRNRMFEEIRSRIPRLAAWMESCYGSQPLLHLGEDTLLSCCGVQQGDPLGPLGFALTLHPISERIDEEVPDLTINAWYLDDGTLCGSPEDLAKALKIIEEDGPSRGLHLNRAKSLLYVPADADISSNPLPPDIPTVQEGFTLLGCPIGPPSFCETTMMKRLKKLQEALDMLPDMKDSQMEATLLRSCLALPKVAFILRTTPPSHIAEAIRAFDNSMRDALADLAGGPLPEWAWLKASLPSSRGGLGIRRASLHAHGSYISSLDQSRSLIARILRRDPRPSPHLPVALSALSEVAARPEWSSLEEVDVPLRQRPLSHCVDDATYDRLLTSAPDIRSRALAVSTALPHAGDWLNVTPSPTLGLHLQDREFRLCLDYWLGLSMTKEGPCPVCGSRADPFGDHQVGCGGNGDRIHRHDSIRDALFSVAQTAALAPRKEVPSLIPDTLSRPADVYLPNWMRGQPAALDISVISTMQQLTLQGAANIPGYALGVGEERKMAAHAEECRAVGITFIPLVVETLGGWSEDAIHTIRAIGRLQGQRLGIPPAESTRHLFQRLAISLWKGNASLWLRRLPFSSAAVDGII